MSPIGAAFHLLLAALDKFEIPYAVCGSMASSAYGSYRNTRDVDILVDIPAEHISAFGSELSEEFYVDVDEMRDAFRRGRSCNAIHKASASKFDLFPAGAGAFEQSELRRRRHLEVDMLGLSTEFSVVSPEDVLLSKLRWYRRGGEGSEQQWRDVSGVVAVQGDQLDRAYLGHWARELGVEDLLARLLAPAEN